MELDRAVGKIEGRIDGIEASLRQYKDDDNAKFARIEGKLETLIGEKNQRHGIATAISAIVAFLVAVLAGRH